MVPSNFALPASSINETAGATGDLSTLTTAISVANLGSVLATGGPYTVFAVSKCPVSQQQRPRPTLQFPLIFPFYSSFCFIFLFTLSRPADFFVC